MSHEETLDDDEVLAEFAIPDKVVLVGADGLAKGDHFACVGTPYYFFRELTDPFF